MGRIRIHKDLGENKKVTEMLTNAENEFRKLGGDG